MNCFYINNLSEPNCHPQPPSSHDSRYSLGTFVGVSRDPIFFFHVSTVLAEFARSYSAPQHAKHRDVLTRVSDRTTLSVRSTPSIGSGPS